MPSLETAHAELYLEVYSGLSAGYSSPSFPMVTVEESLAHLCPFLWGKKLSTGLVWYYLWEWHQANYTGFQSIFPFLYKEEKNPKQQDYCSECLRVAMGDHSVGLCVGDDRSVLAWLPLPLLQSPLPCLVLRLCTKTHEVTCVSQINMLKLQ